MGEIRLPYCYAPDFLKDQEPVVQRGRASASCLAPWRGLYALTAGMHNFVHLPHSMTGSHMAMWVSLTCIVESHYVGTVPMDEARAMALVQSANDGRHRTRAGAILFHGGVE